MALIHLIHCSRVFTGKPNAITQKSNQPIVRQELVLLFRQINQASALKVSIRTFHPAGDSWQMASFSAFLRAQLLQ
jgi:hypothetical protein